jgi:hypothetical protein
MRLSSEVPGSGFFFVVGTASDERRIQDASAIGLLFEEDLGVKAYCGKSLAVRLDLKQDKLLLPIISPSNSGSLK